MRTLARDIVERCVGGEFAAAPGARPALDLADERGGKATPPRGGDDEEPFEKRDGARTWAAISAGYSPRAQSAHSAMRSASQPGS